MTLSTLSFQIRRYHPIQMLHIEKTNFGYITLDISSFFIVYNSFFTLYNDILASGVLYWQNT